MIDKPQDLSSIGVIPAISAGFLLEGVNFLSHHHERTPDLSGDELQAQLEAYYLATHSTVPDPVKAFRRLGVMGEAPGHAPKEGLPDTTGPQVGIEEDQEKVYQQLGSYYRSTGSFDPTGR